VRAGDNVIEEEAPSFIFHRCLPLIASCGEDSTVRIIWKSATYQSDTEVPVLVYDLYLLE